MDEGERQVKKRKITLEDVASGKVSMKEVKQSLKEIEEEKHEEILSQITQTQDENTKCPYTSCPFDKKDQYYWCHFERKYAYVAGSPPWTSLYDLVQNFQKDIIKVWAYISPKYYVIKQSRSQLFHVIPKLDKSVDFRMMFWQHKQNGNPEKKMITFKKLLDGMKYPIYSCMDLNPNPDVKECIFNTWTGFATQCLPISFEEAERDCSIILDFLSKVICNGYDRHHPLEEKGPIQEWKDEETRKYYFLLAHLAACLCHPDHKPAVLFLLLGAQGGGKSTFFQIVKKVFGSDCFFQTSDITQITGGFNSQLCGVKAVVLDDFLATVTPKNWEELKSKVRDGTFPCTYKYKECAPARNRFLTCAGMNPSKKFKLSIDDDERTLVPYLLNGNYVATKHPERQQYWTDFYATVGLGENDKPNMQILNAFHTYLVKHPLLKELALYPIIKTAYKDAILYESHPRRVKFLSYLKSYRELYPMSEEDKAKNWYVNQKGQGLSKKEIVEEIFQKPQQRATKMHMNYLLKLYQHWAQGGNKDKNDHTTTQDLHSEWAGFITRKDENRYPIYLLDTIEKVAPYPFPTEIEEFKDFND